MNLLKTRYRIVKAKDPFDGRDGYSPEHRGPFTLWTWAPLKVGGVQMIFLSEQLARRFFTEIVFEAVVEVK